MNPYFFLNQVIGDFWNCDLDDDTMNSPEFMISAARDAVKLSKSKIIKHIDHKFDPQGYTLLMVLADSSLTLHSWPEEKFVCVEIFTCSQNSDPNIGLKYLAGKFRAEKFEMHTIKR